MALTFVAALALYALVMPISAFAATPTTIEVSNSSEFDNAVATINAATSGEYIIELTDDIQTGGSLILLFAACKHCWQRTHHDAWQGPHLRKPVSTIELRRGRWQ